MAFCWALQTCYVLEGPDFDTSMSWHQAASKAILASGHGSPAAAAPHHVTITSPSRHHHPHHSMLHLIACCSAQIAALGGLAAATYLTHLEVQQILLLAFGVVTFSVADQVRPISRALLCRFQNSLPTSFSPQTCTCTTYNAEPWLISTSSARTHLTQSTCARSWSRHRCHSLRSEMPKVCKPIQATGRAAAAAPCQ